MMAKSVEWWYDCDWYGSSYLANCLYIIYSIIMQFPLGRYRDRIQLLPNWFSSVVIQALTLGSLHRHSHIEETARSK